MKAMTFVFLSLVFFTLGEAASKMWANHPGFRWGAAVVAAYIIGSCLWLPAILSKNHLTSLGTLWNVGAMVGTILVGAVLFRETVSPIQWIGVGLAIVACVLLSV
ncbi:MAG: hypothetical protein A2293_00845 [Elusimicrobia bacterium RIFOXYB2_FULL_49_7]|nr:MAG: hypothetical protein A2293_00845 [Elusimicrobia bacterium RIFOXYB2_FULL_49_7]